ncbi:threonine dehydrogenase-like Zn-dependent dehydrogenase [Gordonia amarae]|nr:alcohol dehydrogenase catalytic domain-containing protein [Gordonia amarae]MCS3880704.1 threonine dehydrogenase-like Zn-dependent dehydrogenase [Gordonia amarae]GAB04776.1 putative zinc-containing alcohol dehydrogenase [Gordonia amarae NBRC 15530]
MKSLIAEGSELTLQEVPDAAIEKPTDAVVRMVLASVCGSDHHLLEYNIPMAYPIGHEAIGEVVEIGSDISGLTVGDRVLLAGDVGCGRCQPCRSGSIKRCKNGEFGIYGSPGPLGGCQSELIRVPFADFNALKIPEGITDEQALTITDCLPTAYTAVARANIRPGGTAAVIGIGPIGLIAVEVAFALGAATVYAIDLLDDRLAKAKELGAIALKPEEALEKIKADTGGDLVDSVIEAVGAKATVDLGFQLTGANRTFSILGAVHGVDVTLPFESVLRGITVTCDQTTEIPLYWPELIPLVQAGRLHPEIVFTDRFKLDDVKAAYEKARSREPGTIKVLIEP